MVNPHEAFEFDASEHLSGYEIADTDDEQEPSPLETFITSGQILEVLYPVRAGKEAQVFCCRADPSLGVPLVAAKLYKDTRQRSFKNNASYLEGRYRRENRAVRAMKAHTAVGREMAFGAWVGHEYEMLQRLSQAGLDVPRPQAQAGAALLMDFIGDEDGPSPSLREAHLSPSDAQWALDRILWNIERMLDLNVVHGDLSPYNILWHQEMVVLIDFPQCSDPRFNGAAAELLERDVTNVCNHFARLGVHRDARAISRDLWTRFRFGALSGRW